MKLTSLNLSFPIKSYMVRVSHFTPRRSTAIEWVILQAAEAVQNNPRYGDVSIASFFTGVLKISDPNLLVKPCINNLIDINALESSSEIHDDADLSEVHMRELRLTSDGHDMQQRGLLPGSVMETDVLFWHNLFNQELSLKRGRALEDTPTGVSISAYDDVENVSMPIQAIRNYLQNPENAKNFQWMNASTEIREVVEVSSESGSSVKWQNQLNSVDFSGDGKITVGKFDSDVLDRVTEYLESDCQKYRLTEKTLEKLKLTNVDAEYSKVVLPKSLVNAIQKDIQDCAVSFVNKNLCEMDLHDMPNKSYRIVVLYGTDEFNCEFITKTKLLLISVPKDLNLDKEIGSTVFASKLGQYLLNKVEIYGENYRTSIPMALKPKKMSFDFNRFMEELVNLNKEKNEDVLFILPMLGFAEQFVNSVVGLLTNTQKNFDEKLEFLSNIASKSRRYLGKTYIPSRTECDLLYKDWNIESLSADSVIDRLQNLLGHEYIASNVELAREGAQIILGKWGEIKDLDAYLKVLNYLESAKCLKMLFNSHDGSSVLLRDRFIDLLIRSFDMLPAKMPFAVGIESALLDLQTAYRSLLKELESIGYVKNSSDSEKKNSILSVKDGLLILNSLVAKNKKAKLNLQELLKKLASEHGTTIVSLDDLDSRRYALISQSFALAREIGNIISPYLGLMNFTFDEVYVTDTCAIMHHPEMLDTFKKNKSAFVVPKEVIRELDGLKRNLEKAQQAQTAAKKINECMNSMKNGNRWLFIEEGDESLLPMEYRGGDQKTKGDDLILSVALKFKIRDPILLVDDINFSNKAYGEYLRQMTSEEFINKVQKKRN